VSSEHEQDLKTKLEAQQKRGEDLQKELTDERHRRLKLEEEHKVNYENHEAEV
jgi:hypothetical protein